MHVHDSGVQLIAKQHADRILSEDCFSRVHSNRRTTDLNGPFEPMVLSRFEAGGIGPYHVLHLDPFAFVMKPEDERMRGLHRELIGECDERVQLHGPAAASVFFTWGSNNAAAKAGHLNCGYGGGHDNGYQALVAVAHRDQRIVITWCRELHFFLLCIVPTDAKERVARAVATEVAWLKPLMRIIEVDHGGA